MLQIPLNPKHLDNTKTFKIEQGFLEHKKLIEEILKRFLIIYIYIYIYIYICVCVCVCVCVSACVCLSRMQVD